MTEAQARAIQYVRLAATKLQSLSLAAVEEVLAQSGVAASNIDFMISNIRDYARITVNFHPDRLLSSGVTVAEGLLRDGIYRGQFETSISNGSRTAFSGGDRDRWEEHLFGKAYHRPEVKNGERPKYGGLNLMNYADGASPRFGSCHLWLYPHVFERSTFTFGDSHAGPERVGTIDCFTPVFAALFEAARDTQQVLGMYPVDIPSLAKLLINLPAASEGGSMGPVGRSLNDYIETQIHSDIDLASDAEALIADPSFQETGTGDVLQAICSKFSLNLEWHEGFRLDVQSVPEDFRGPAMPPLAARIDRSFAITPGQLDAATLGLAAASLQRSPVLWEDWGTYEETLQHIKQLWHVLVQYGHPIYSAT